MIFAEWWLEPEPCVRGAWLLVAGPATLSAAAMDSWRNSAAGEIGNRQSRTRLP